MGRASAQTTKEPPAGEHVVLSPEEDDMNLRFSSGVALVAVMTSACVNWPAPEAGARDAGPAASAVPPLEEHFAERIAAQLQPLAAPPAGQAVQGSGAQIPAERKLIRQGQMTLRVTDIGAALRSLGEIVASVGGQTADQSEQLNQFGARTASITCRIPAERLEEAVEAARALGELRALTLTTDDVTAEYFDVSVRIRTQKALEQQLVGLLGRASNRLSDLLEIERELARVREEIDRLEGRVRLWDNQTAMASLAMTLEEPAPLAATTGGPLVTLGVAFLEAAENFVLALAGLIAAAGSILPGALILGVIGWMGLRHWRRTRAPAAPAA
jgi:hypothetical protein